MRRIVILTLLLALSGLAALGSAGCAATRTASSEGDRSSALSNQLPADTPGAEMIVHGMTCPFCATNLEKSLTSINGVDQVEIDLGTGRVVVLFGQPHPAEADLRTAVDQSGFTLKEIRVQ